MAIVSETFDINASGVVKTPAAGRRLRLHAYFMTPSADITVMALKFGAAGAPFFKVQEPAKGAQYGRDLGPDRSRVGGAGEALHLDFTGVATVTVTLEYREGA